MTSSDKITRGNSTYETVSVTGISVYTVISLEPNDFRYTSDQWHPSRSRALKSFIDNYQCNFSDELLAKTLIAGYASDGYLVIDNNTYMEEYKAFTDCFSEQHPLCNGQATQKGHQNDFDAGQRYFVNATRAANGRRLFVTESGVPGLGPLAIAIGDIVAVLFGGSVPFILRPNGDGEHYRLVGECYVHNIMDGQAVKQWQDSGKSTTLYKLF